ncbi:MAG TPA: hemerythrin domain-containing protein [Nocardioides sp.]|uniref:hemerythrin domain-containing protein n=1 Tax=Nocardioides sp. TaxID=35761 RepID=UPI002ED7964E
MGSAAEDRAEAARLPEGDVVRILLEQHARIRELFAEVTTASGDAREGVFHELRVLLAVHETAEEMVLRPVSGEFADEVAAARNQEEADATEALAELEKLDLGSPEFLTRIAALRESVIRHAEAEEHEEFPLVLAHCDDAMRQRLGKQVLAAESLAPTHPHPTVAGHTGAQFAAGPFLAMLDRAKDAFRRTTD